MNQKEYLLQQSEKLFFERHYISLARIYKKLKMFFIDEMMTFLFFFRKSFSVFTKPCLMTNVKAIVIVFVFVIFQAQVTLMLMQPRLVEKY